MKAADMVYQSELVSRWADGKRLAFLGDGDSISACVAYLKHRGIVRGGPLAVTVFDFDERVVSAINRFADKERIETLSATLYNCLDPLPPVDKFDRFYTNPPWGASNGGHSVNVFIQRGMELLHFEGEGMVVVADADESRPWTERVLAAVQRFGRMSGFFVSYLMPGLHEYHLDDDPDLRSCNLILKSLPRNQRAPHSRSITDRSRTDNFYGEGLHPDVRYVRERKRVDYGTAHDDEYMLEPWGGAND